MDTSLFIRHQFDMEISHRKFVIISSIMKDEYTSKRWHRFHLGNLMSIGLLKSMLNERNL